MTCVVVCSLQVVRVGSYEFQYHPNFCLYLSTSVPLFVKGNWSYMHGCCKCVMVVYYLYVMQYRRECDVMKYHENIK